MDFPFGQVVVTPGALQALQKAEQAPHQFLARHGRGDWGEIPDADRRHNADAVQRGSHIVSAYTTSAGDRLWVITEADRSVTTLLLPEEY